MHYTLAFVCNTLASGLSCTNRLLYLLDGLREEYAKQITLCIASGRTIDANVSPIQICKARSLSRRALSHIDLLDCDIVQRNYGKETIAREFLTVSKKATLFAGSIAVCA